MHIKKLQLWRGWHTNIISPPNLERVVLTFWGTYNFVLWTKCKSFEDPFDKHDAECASVSSKYYDDDFFMKHDGGDW